MKKNLLLRAIPIKTVAAIVIGGAIEWYDFIIYSLMTVYIAAVFFPATDSTYSVLATTATFGVAFFVRPLGALILGLYADKKGRKSAMLLIISIMATALILISIVPSYAAIGMAAPLLLISARLLQGFSASGECGAASALLFEISPRNQRGFYTSWQTVAQTSGMILGAAVGTLLTTVLSESQIYAWGWRIPFMVGLLIIPVGLYLRRQLIPQDLLMTMTSNQLSDFSAAQRPLSHLRMLVSHYRQLLIAIGLVAGGTATTYINLSYMATYTVRQLHLPMQAAFLVQLMSVSLLTIGIPFFGRLSDKIGKKILMLISIGSYMMVVYPLFVWLTTDTTLLKLIVTENLLCLLLSPFFGVSTVVVAELFPTRIRSTALGVSSNVGVMLFGGFAQFIVTWLIKVTGTPVAISYYLLFALTITLIAILCYQDKKFTLQELCYEHS